MRAKLTRDHLTTHMTAPNLNWIANGVLGLANAVLREVDVLGSTDVVFPMVVPGHTSHRQHAPSPAMRTGG